MECSASEPCRTMGGRLLTSLYLQLGLIVTGLILIVDATHYGSRCEKGEKGYPGPLGLNGMPGSPGLQGPIGRKGEAGRPGTIGQPGPPGHCPTMLSCLWSLQESCAKGTVAQRLKTTVECSSSSDSNIESVVEITIAACLACSVDVGSPGAPGPQGIPGPPGPKVTGSRGEPGPPGKKGERGADGLQGPTGVKGQRGQRGIKGQKGDVGEVKDKDKKDEISKIPNGNRSGSIESSNLSETVATGITYTHWGLPSCPPQATTLYSGFAAETRTQISNLLCIPSQPSPSSISATLPFQGASTTEIKPLLFKGKTSQQAAAMPCAKCYLERRSNVFVYPASSVCPRDWEVVYSGVLVTDDSYHVSEFVCLDVNTAVDMNQERGMTIDSVKVVCPQYVAECKDYTYFNQPLPCAVCAK